MAVRSIRFADDPRIAWFLGAAQAALAIAAVLGDHYLNNEGILTWIFASMLADDPIAVLFFLKARPPLSVLYALPSALGFEAFAIVHAIVASLAVPLTAIVARAVGQPRPNLAAALVFTSALAFPAAAAGVGNADGMLLTILCAALLFAWKRPALAGVVAVALPLARAETSILVLGLAAFAIVEGPRVRRRFFAGAIGSGSVYALAGALYHGDLLWFLHYPPHVMHAVPARDVMGVEAYGGELHAVILHLVALLPAIGLFPFLRIAKTSRAERAMAGSALVFTVLLSAMPSTAAFNFDDAPRYVLPALPFLAICLNRAIEPLASSVGPSREVWTINVVWLGALLVLAHFQEAVDGAPALLWAVAGWSLVVALAGTRARRLVPVAIVAISIVALPFLLPSTRLAHPGIEILGARVIRDATPTNVVLTNATELPMWVARNGGEELDVRHMLATDQLYELDYLANESVGQRARIHALLRDHWYGPIVFPDEIDALLVPGTWLALRFDERTVHILDEPALRARSEVVDLGQELRILEVVSP